MANKECLDPFCSHHSEDTPPVGRFRWILREIWSHLPFSIISAIAGMAIMLVITMVGKEHHLVNMFHLFHPAHILLSSIATTAMFWRLSSRKNIVYAGYAIIIGITGSLIVCSLSDIFLPYLCGHLMSGGMGWHFCLVDHFMVVLPFVFLGVLIGLWSGAYSRYGTFLSHSCHVFVNTMATLIYLITFGVSDWMSNIGLVLLVTVFSVLIPCCLSDIVYPMLFTDRRRNHQTEV